MMYAMIVYLLHGDMGYIMEEASWWLCHKLSVPVALPQIICSGGTATKYLYLVTLSHFLYLAAMLHISVACSGWVGRVVSPHGERLVWGCMWLDMGWVLHRHVISVLFCYRPMGFILTSVLG